MKRLFIISGIVLTFIYGIFLVVLFWPRNQVNNVPPGRSNIPTPTVRSQSNVEFHSALPQEFPSGDKSKRGTLEVVSFPDGARVMLDTSSDSDATHTTFPPVNYTPFNLMRMPVGTYSLYAAKSGYNFTYKQFVIRENQTTRVEITLSPL